MDYKRIIIQWKEFEIPKTLPREIEIPLDNELITTITGPRRAGKTYLCFHLIHQLIKKGIPRDNLLYINFEDEKILGGNANDLSKLFDTFQELTSISKNKPVYLFLDEIQNVKDWDAWIRRIHDTEKNIKLILTGSSSKLLSKEISTKLRGRVLNHEVFPLSFRELLLWKNLDYDIKTISHSKKRFAIKKAFSSYLKGGGYPALICQDLPKEQVLQSYFDVMILRDVIERHEIKETTKMRVLANLLFESISKEISYNRLTNKMKSLGFRLSKNTIIEYISHFDDAYLFFQNLKYEYSLTKQLGAIKKLYCIDNGLLNAVSFKFSDDVGKLLENAVYIGLRRENRAIYYHRDNYECDFLVKRKNKIVEAIQVTQELNDDNIQREIKGLLEAMETHKLNKGLILTSDTEEERTIKGKKIVIVPVWKWLLKQAK